ncbi:MAG: pentapeptide repeat-containing protein [Terriglobales bacterium]|jgi:uncharacterized protein YjbI with pentapeptide repeats
MAKPPTVTVRGRELPVCSHGECEEARIWDYATCWEHLKDAERENIRERPSDALRQKESLSGIILTGADLSGFDFTAADLSGAHLDKCRLRTSKFVEANLRRAYLGWSNLDNTDLSRAELDRCVFTNCSLENVRLLAYSISFGREPINLEATLFGAAKLFRRPHIDESHPWSAEATYRALKSYFIREADYESASWASYCEKTMQRKVLWQGDKRHWLVSAFLAISCGYGEKPLRVIATAGWVVIIFGVLFVLLHCATLGGSFLGWQQGLYFSFATLSGVSFPDILPAASPWIRLLIASERAVGILLLGLFVFTLTKRFVAR